MDRDQKLICARDGSLSLAPVFASHCQDSVGKIENAQPYLKKAQALPRAIMNRQEAKARDQPAHYRRAFRAQAPLTARRPQLHKAAAPGSRRGPRRSPGMLR